MPFYDPQARQARELVAGIAARTFWGEQMLLAVVELDDGAVLPRHHHPHEQAGVVLSGQLELTIEGETKLLPAGAVYVIPGNAEHHARAPHGPVRVIDIFSPVREEYKFP